ncbi:hypothetical protein FPRO05_10568 [Fusarium proliferatum]|uniref:Transcription factor domain-containing protein n=1 Tax=Gibberella intermedia TaxID=948311 RepID=A0A365NBT6_GIBIN|nr:hypothetical protein FPRO05_10568 [Fusarium proliferatum]
MSSNRHYVQVFTDVPANLLRLLEARLPQSITLLRRLHFTTFPTVKTDSARIIAASDVPLQERSASNTIRHFTATYLDPSLGLETNMWLYSTFEDSYGAIPASPSLSPDEDALCRLQIIAVLNEARHQARVYPIQPLAHSDHIFIGSLNNAVREGALASGLRFGPTPTYEYGKFIFRIDELPLPHELELPSDMVWGSGTVRDCEPEAPVDTAKPVYQAEERYACGSGVLGPEVATLASPVHQCGATQQLTNLSKKASVLTKSVFPNGQGNNGTFFTLNSPQINPTPSNINACQPISTKIHQRLGNPAENKGRSCEYTLQGNKNEILIRRQQALQENVESFTALYRYLQDRPANEASNFFERIRNGFGIEAALEFVKNEGSTSVSTSRDPASARLAWSQQVYDCNLLFENELLSTETSDATIQAMRDGVNCYFSCLGTMYPIYTREETDSITDTFLKSQEGKPNQVLSRKIAYGELLAICAVGFQYDRQTLPNGSASICTPFYQKARLFLDYAVEKAPLHWGILLGSSSGLCVRKRPHTLSEQDFKGYVKTFTALITVRSWLTATLGHIPSPEVSRCIHETRQQMDNTGVVVSAGEDAVIGILQEKMAQITILKANVLRTVACFRVLSPAILRQMHQDLDIWRSSLPPCLRLETLMHTPQISPDQRRVTFYMHLFYMSAFILKARALVATQEDIAVYIWDPEAMAAVFEGVHAARNSARLLGLIHEEKAVVKNCWLTIYQCYVTFLMLNFTAIKSFLVGGAAAFRQQDIVLSRPCIEILALCATRDRIARSFHARLAKYQDTIQEQLPGFQAETLEDSGSYGDGSFDDDSYLFIESSGNSKLHHLIHELRELLCHPLALLKGESEASIPYPTISKASVGADINFAHHLASPFNMAEDEIPTGLFPPDESLGGSHNYAAETEGYLSGSVPFGWDISTWRRDPGSRSSKDT